MRRDAVSDGEVGEGEGDDAAVGTTGDEEGGRELELADEGGVALEEGQTLAGTGVPDADGGVEPTAGYAFAVESHGIDLVEVTSEDVNTFASIDVP